MEEKLKEMEAMESAESAKPLDSGALDAVSGGWEEPDGSISEAGGEPCKPRCKNSDCVLVDTKAGVFWKTNHYYRCKKCGNYFMKGWALDGADNSLLFERSRH